MIKFDNENLTVKLEKYSYGDIAICLTDEEGMPYATMSVHVDGVQADGCIVLKDYYENKDIAKACVDQGLFIPTGVMVPVGNVECPLCKVNMDMIG